MHKKTYPHISIIIANFNSKDFIANCLNSILQEKKTNYEVVVVDDCSTDTSLEIIQSYTKKYPHISLVSLKINVGATKIRNIGVANSRGEILFFLDCDTELKTGWYDEIISFFNTYHDAGMAQAKLLKKNTHAYDYAGDYLNDLCFLTERAQGVKDRGQFDHISKIFSVKGAAMIMRKTVFKSLGGFDEDYHYYWEEPDLAWRIWLAGHAVYFLPTIIVFHAYVTKEKNTAYYVGNDIIYKGCRNAITTLIKNLGFSNLLWRLPLHVFSWLLLSLFICMKGEFAKSYAIVRGIGWNILHLNHTLKKRKQIQSKRVISDSYLFQTIGSQKSVSYFAHKAWSYINGKPY